MQPIDTNNESAASSTEPARVVNAGSVADFPHGSCKTIELPAGRELALYNINGEFYATENVCPHKGAPLASGILCEYVIECDWHGWQFDVRNGECLTAPEKIETYEVLVDDGVVKILI